MNTLYGADSCTECKITKKWLDKTPFQYQYVDVSTFNFEGPIPQLTTDNGQTITGLGPIKNYVQQYLINQGFIW